LYSILEHQTPIVEMLQHPTTATEAEDLIRSHQSRNSKICRDCLLLGGIAISKEQIPNCMSNDEEQALISLVRSWIVDSLNSSSQGSISESAEALQAFWDEEEITIKGVLSVLMHLTHRSKN
jgi:hypothetical protein